jgi:proteic killer suppression protein
MIVTFRSRQAKQLFERESVKGFASMGRVALRKLQQLHFATQLSDLSAPPGNRLELLKGDRRGQHSIRINEQWRICFVWRNGNAYDVEIVDYH